jgi:SH3-like domain-containing protein
MSRRIAILPDAVGVSIVGQCRDEWCPIYHRGITGWVNSLYLIEDKTVRGLERDQRGAGPDYQQ